MQFDNAERRIDWGKVDEPRLEPVGLGEFRERPAAGFDDRLRVPADDPHIRADKMGKVQAVGFVFEMDSPEKVEAKRGKSLCGQR